GPEEHLPTGKRIFDVAHLFRQLFSSVKHEPFDCDLSYMYVVKEVRKGLRSSFELKCKMCGIQKTIFSESDTSEELGSVNINSGITSACVFTGIGYNEFEEIAASINMPMMAYETYNRHQQCVIDVIHETAWQTMEDAGKEEAALARQLGEVDKNQIPCVTVIADGAWSKRSYNVKYGALSGVCLLPELIDPRKKRGLTIRNAPRDTIRDYSELKSY
ncbi:hypothetical protein ILUMI_13889, partial [Ignelater luminosus]